MQYFYDHTQLEKKLKTKPYSIIHVQKIFNFGQVQVKHR